MYLHVFSTREYAELIFGILFVGICTSVAPGWLDGLYSYLKSGSNHRPVLAECEHSCFKNRGH
jgi:hypothetical protein